MRPLLIAASVCVLTVLSCTSNLDPLNLESSSDQVPVQSVGLYVSTLKMKPGDKAELTARIFPENATNKEVIWTTSDTEVVTIVDGKVTAIAPGEATITVTSGICAAECSVSVTAHLSNNGN